jgi:ribosomal protein L23
VKVIKIPAKKRRIGKTQGFRKGYKKAIVKIREDQKIEIL